MSNLPVLMTHEFTHALHALSSPDFSKDDETASGVFEPLWEEGLAEVHSQMLVTGVDLPSVFMDQFLSSKCTSTNVKIWASSYLKDAKLPLLQLKDKLNEWFSVSSMQNPMGVQRAGYCLGYNIVLSALQTHSFKELLKMNHLEAYNLIKKSLQDFSEKN